MNARLIRMALALGFLMLVQTTAAAQIPKPDPAATLSKYVDRVSGTDADEAVRVALASNDELAAMKLETESSTRMIGQAEQRARPSVGFESRQQVGGSRNRSMVMGTIPLELGGRRSSRVALAERMAALDRALYEEKERMLAAEVRTKFGRALAKALKLKLTEDTLLFVIESYELVKANVTEGETAPLEENMLLVEVNRLRSMREKDEGAVRIAMLELKNLLGLGPEAPLLLKGDFEGLIEPLPPLRAATDAALGQRPDLEALRAAIEVGRAKIDQFESDSGIDAALNLGYERMTDDAFRGGDHMVIFGVRITLPYGNRNRDAIEASVLDKQAAEQRLEFGELVVRREVASAFARYEYAVKALEIFRVGVASEAFRNLEVVRQTYEFGSASLIDYLSEQGRYLDYQAGLIDAQLEVYEAKVSILKAGNGAGLK
ncbi:MAG: TolC family protein [Aridibacter famidurans]|nr:TolC family protein [Aridibacter famidurans]